MISRNGLYATDCVSFPRSGHHLFARMMKDYLGNEMVYHSLYEDEPILPIEDPECPANFFKNHDFELKTKISPEIRYIVQLRNPLDSIDSWRNLDMRTGALTNPEDPARWREDYAGRLDYWNGFVKKWLVGYVPNRLVIFYDDLITRTEEVLVSAIQHVRGRQDIDYPKLQAVIAAVKPERRQKNRPQFYLIA